MFRNGTSALAKQNRNLLLSKPDGFFLQKSINFYVAILVFVDDYFATDTLAVCLIG